MSRSSMCLSRSIVCNDRSYVTIDHMSRSIICHDRSFEHIENVFLYIRRSCMALGIRPAVKWPLASNSPSISRRKDYSFAHQSIENDTLANFIRPKIICLNLYLCISKIYFKPAVAQLMITLFLLLNSIELEKSLFSLQVYGCMCSNRFVFFIITFFYL